MGVICFGFFSPSICGLQGASMDWTCCGTSDQIGIRATFWPQYHCSWSFVAWHFVPLAGLLPSADCRRHEDVYFETKSGFCQTHECLDRVSPVQHCTAPRWSVLFTYDLTTSQDFWLLKFYFFAFSWHSINSIHFTYNVMFTLLQATDRKQNSAVCGSPILSSAGWLATSTQY